MITIRKAGERGHTNIGWLDSYHTFSFGEYYDQNQHGFQSLRVINQDKVEPGQGFGSHGHRDMEIISYVLEGELEHKDSMGTGSIIKPGDVQRMSAGSGVMHSERNPSMINPVKFLQIWLFPDKKGLKPSYEQKHFKDEQKEGKLLLVASPDGKNGSLTIHQDAKVYSSILKKGESTTYENPKDRHAWVQVAKGKLSLNGKELKTGDGVAISEKESLKFETSDTTEFLLFDLG